MTTYSSQIHDVHAVQIEQYQNYRNEYFGTSSRFKKYNEGLWHPKAVKTSSPKSPLITKKCIETSAPSTPEVKAKLEVQGILMNYWEDCVFDEEVERDFSPISRDFEMPPSRTENPVFKDSTFSNRRSFKSETNVYGAELGILSISPDL